MDKPKYNHDPNTEPKVPVHMLTRMWASQDKIMHYDTTENLKVMRCLVNLETPEFRDSYKDCIFMQNIGIYDKDKDLLWENDIVLTKCMGIDHISVIRRRDNQTEFYLYPAWMGGHFWGLDPNSEGVDEFCKKVGNIFEYENHVSYDKFHQDRPILSEDIRQQLIKQYNFPLPTKEDKELESRRVQNIVLKLDKLFKKIKKFMDSNFHNMQNNYDKVQGYYNQIKDLITPDERY